MKCKYCGKFTRNMKYCSKRCAGDARTTPIDDLEFMIAKLLVVMTKRIRFPRSPKPTYKITFQNDPVIRSSQQYHGPEFGDC